MPNEHELRVCEATQAAVRKYARTEIQALTRKVIFRLQRIPASGIFGDEYAYKSLWDEYCYEMQQGPHEILDYAWDQTLEQILGGIVDSVPKCSAVLLSIYAAWDLDEEDDPALIGTVWPDGMKQVIKNQLSKQASDRSLNHLAT